MLLAAPCCCVILLKSSPRLGSVPSDHGLRVQTVYKVTIIEDRKRISEIHVPHVGLSVLFFGYTKKRFTAMFRIMGTSFNSYATGLFDVLSTEAQDALVATGTRKVLRDGQLFQSRGTIETGLVIVLKGHIRMMTIGIDGSALLSAVLGPGQQFNEVTLFAGAAQTHDAQAVGDTEVLVLTAAGYEQVAKRHPEIIQALLISNTHRLHQLVETFNDFRALPKSVVVARLLFKNARYQRGSSNVQSVEMEITQDDISMFLGVSRAYLNKVLSQLSDNGLIQLSYRKIRVLDIDALGTWIEDHLTYDPVDDLPGPEPE